MNVAVQFWFYFTVQFLQLFISASLFQLDESEHESISSPTLRMDFTVQFDILFTVHISKVPTSVCWHQVRVNSKRYIEWTTTLSSLGQFIADNKNCLVVVTLPSHILTELDRWFLLLSCLYSSWTGVLSYPVYILHGQVVSVLILSRLDKWSPFLFSLD